MLARIALIAQNGFHNKDDSGQLGRKTRIRFRNKEAFGHIEPPSGSAHAAAPPVCPYPAAVDPAPHAAGNPAPAAPERCPARTPRSPQPARPPPVAAGRDGRAARRGLGARSGATGPAASGPQRRQAAASLRPLRRSHVRRRGTPCSRSHVCAG